MVSEVFWQSNFEQGRQTIVVSLNIIGDTMNETRAINRESRNRLTR
jgi:hypothetical protein